MNLSQLVPPASAMMLEHRDAHGRHIVEWDAALHTHSFYPH